MRIHIDHAGGRYRARLADGGNFGEFSVHLAGPPDLTALNDELTGAVRFSSAEQAWVDARWLREMGGYADGDRGRRFDAMLAYARGKGWVDADTGELAGHVIVVRR